MMHRFANLQIMTHAPTRTARPLLTVRNVISASIALLLLSFVWGTSRLLKEPNSGGAGRDSFGTHGYGSRALYEVLTELGLPVKRSLAPPATDVPVAATYLLWKPSLFFIRTSPTHLEDLRTWAEQGGRVVIAPVPPRDHDVFVAPPAMETHDIGPLDPLGLEDVTLTTADLWSLAAEATTTSDAGDPKASAQEKETNQEEQGKKKSPDDLPDDPALRRQRVRDMLVEIFEPREIDLQTLDVRAIGGLASLGETVQSLQVAEQLVGVVDVSKHPPDGAITFTDADDVEQTLIAQYNVGQGEIIVVGEPALLDNLNLAAEDNSLLAVHLLHDAARPILIDEFYHGLSVRGNPLFLLTRPGFAITLVMLFAGVGLWVWRKAVFLGPALPDEPKRRRAIGEYIEAMSRFLNQGPVSRAFFLQEVRDGTLRTLAESTSLAGGQHTAERIAQAYARKDPSFAREIEAAFDTVDAALAKGSHCGEIETVKAMQQLSRLIGQ